MESVLTPEERARIRQEEVLRAEIRKELAPASPPPSPQGWQEKWWWKILNSTFGIWLLSSVVVAGVVNYYNTKQMLVAYLR